MLRTWSSTQSVIALSSGEAELYATVKGATVLKGAMSSAKDYGEVLDGILGTDSSAAMGMVHRRGLGKVRHIDVQYLWIQEGIHNKDFSIEKVAGHENCADLMTKYLDEATMMRHMQTLNLEYREGRAAIAPKVVAHFVSEGSSPLSSSSSLRRGNSASSM